MTAPKCPHCHHTIPSDRLSYCPICGLSLQPERTLQYFVSENDYASLGARLLARLIDYTIIGILACLIDWKTRGALVEGWQWFSYGITQLAQVTIALWIGILLFSGYFVIFQSLSGRTPGKWLCQIIVLKQGHLIPGVVSNIFREIGIGLTFLTGGWLLLIPIFSSKNKGFHDFLSGVEVFHSREP